MSDKAKRERDHDENDNRKSPDTVRINKVKSVTPRGIVVFPKDDYNMGYGDVFSYRVTGNKKIRKGMDPNDKSTFGTEEASVDPTEHVSSEGGYKNAKKRTKRKTHKRRHTKKRKYTKKRRSHKKSKQSTRRKKRVY